MCGIAGIVNFQSFDLEKVKNALYHRGPDEQTIYTKNNVALIQTRLAIQDIAQGKQPFHFAHFSIVFNGEIYNHLALRSLLTEFSFKTHSDTETLLYLYLKYQENLFNHIDGMFAFCIYDKCENTFFIARDRAGKKPLYYVANPHHFIFASELNAIRAIQPLTINEDAIHCYLRAGFIYKPYTPYFEVMELDAGCFMQVNLTECQRQIRRYYSILDTYQSQTNQLDFAESMNLVETHLQQSIKDRLLSADVEVGAFLSGGIDSNLIVAMAASVNHRLKTFTVKFDDEYDESHLANLTAQQYGTNHTEIAISYQLENDIENILRFYGEPFMDSSAVPSYYVAKEAKKHVSVILNGDGADELFGGYRRYVAIAHNLSHFFKFLSPIKYFLPKPHQKKSLYNYFYRLLAMGSKTGIDFYLSATFDIYEDVLTFASNPIFLQMEQFINDTLANPLLTSLSKILYLDFNLLLFSDLLVKMDIATMANSLEGRSPFLSKAMLEIAPKLPDHFKIKKTTTKFILRELAKKYLSPQLINQPKRGFEVPLKKWVEVDLKQKIYDSLLPGCYAENFLERSFIDYLLKKTPAISAEKRAKILWGLFCLESWYRNEKKREERTPCINPLENAVSI